MGVVYEARQVSFNRPVALKVLGAGLGLSPRTVQREAEAEAKVHNANIAPIYATNNGGHGGVMAELSGGYILSHFGTT